MSYIEKKMRHFKLREMRGTSKETEKMTGELGE